MGYEVGPVGRWSPIVEDYYPIRPKSRWGHEHTPHPQLKLVLEQGRAQYEEVLQQLKVHSAILHEIRHDHDPHEPTAPFWDNGYFQSFDAACLVGFLLLRQPKRYLEIGSGQSTKFARHAIRIGRLPTTIISIDPQPRAEIDALCDRVLREPLEECELAVFDELEPGDLLFFDGSHRVFQNSDVVVFFLEILPRLKPGVMVHIHDVFLPADYPPAWSRRLYSEQYMLGAMLLCEAPPFRTVLPNYFVCTDRRLSMLVREIFKAPDGSLMLGALFRGATDVAGSSFWIETAS
jgi:predicted O-methyltransferase YrrM